jgi:hypothetical protein
MVPMNKLVALTVTATAAVGALAPAAGAQSSPAQPLKVSKAYLVKTHIGKQDFVKLVFKTADPLTRRYDGSIQAGASIEGVNHSIGSAKKGSTWYTALSEIKGGTIATTRPNSGKVTRKGAKVGRTYTVKMFTRDGQSVTRTLKLRATQPKLS